MQAISRSAIINFEALSIPMANSLPIPANSASNLFNSKIYETTADHNLLKLLSEKYGGQLVYPNQLSSVAGLIKDKGTIKPVIYETSKTRSVINLKWIFFLLLGLLTLEWFFPQVFLEGISAMRSGRETAELLDARPYR